MSRLNALKVKKLSEAGKYQDGDGLVLQVTISKKGVIKKSWTVRYGFNGKRREIGIGPYPLVSLADARCKAREVKLALLEGVDPIEARRKARIEPVDDHDGVMTFAKCADKYISVHERGWSNPKHRQQWKNTLKTYVLPLIGNKDVALVNTNDMKRILGPIWVTKTETATRVRGRVEAIISWAIVYGYRTSPNPAVWTNNLDYLFPKPSRIAPVKHHRAMDWRSLPKFVAELRTRPGASARALEFTILTAARSGEVRMATWREIDISKRLWSIPGIRTKSKRDHRVPLSDRAIRLLENRKANFGSNPKHYIFFNSEAKSPDPKKPFSDAVYRALFKRMDLEGLTTHGFRSSFRDWAGDCTDHARETTEFALSHQIGNKAEMSYRREDALEKRRVLMQDWANFLSL